MWESKESVYNVIKPPPKKKPRTPPRAPDNAPWDMIENVSKSRMQIDIWKKIEDSSESVQKPMTVRNLLWKMHNNLHLQEAATFGYLPGSAKPRPSKFLLKHSKERQLEPLRRSRNGGGSVSDRCISKKPPLPDLAQHPPKFGLRSDTNYITENAVMVIRAKPNNSHCPKEEKSFSAQQGFGRVPLYLVKRKNEVAKKLAKDSPENQAKCLHPGTRRLDNEEKQTLVNGLKIKWALVNAEYQRLPFIADTDAQKNRQNRYEEELENLQRDISLLSRKIVLVSEGGPSKIKPSVL